MRTRARTTATSLAIAATSLTACNSLTPCGFWKEYRHDAVVAQFSDQGPWGGHRWIQWSSPSADEFSAAGVTEFAESHGWKRVDTKHYSAEEVSNWVTNRGPVFPLIYENQGMSFNVYCDRYPRAMDGPLTVIRFDSRWIRVPPGTGEGETAFGFVLISDDGRQLAIYHAWGET